MMCGNIDAFPSETTASTSRLQADGCHSVSSRAAPDGEGPRNWSSASALCSVPLSDGAVMSTCVTCSVTERSFAVCAAQDDNYRYALRLCTRLFPLVSAHEEDHFHHRGASGHRAVLAGRPSRVDDILRRPGPARPEDRADRFGRYFRANPPRARQSLGRLEGGRTHDVQRGEDDRLPGRLRRFPEDE